LPSKSVSNLRQRHLGLGRSQSQKPLAMRVQRRTYASPRRSRRHVAMLSPPLTPFDRRTWRYSKAQRCRPARLTSLNRANHALSKIVRTGSRHPMLTSNPARMVNQKIPSMGIPPDSIQPKLALVGRGCFLHFPGGADGEMAEDQVVSHGRVARADSLIDLAVMIDQIVPCLRAVRDASATFDVRAFQ